MKDDPRELWLLPIVLLLVLIVLFTSPGPEDRRAVDEYMLATPVAVGR